MKCNDIKKQFISLPRLKQYKSIDEYIQNIKLSQQFYIPLSVVEISLRNSLNMFFMQKVGKIS